MLKPKTDEERRIELNRLLFRSPYVRDVRSRPRFGYLLVSLGFTIVAVVPFIVWPLLSRFLFPMYPMESQFDAFDKAFLPSLVFRLLAVVAGAILIRDGWRFVGPKSEDVILADTHLPVLYLRSFSDDRDGLWGIIRLSYLPFFWAFKFWKRPRTDESVLVSSLRHVGPVIALGRPGDKFQSFGAARICVDNEYWPTLVPLLMELCQFTVLSIGSSRGVSEELRMAASTCGPHKLILKLPGKILRRRKLYSALRAELEQALRCSLPSRIGRAQYIRFKEGWVPETISSVAEWSLFVDNVSWRQRESPLPGMDDKSLPARSKD